MAKRKMLFHPDYVREKIRASQLINRLQSCAMGEIELTIPQIRAIEILLRKCVPDLAETRACHRRAGSNLDAGQQSGAVGATAVPGVRSVGRTARDPRNN